MDDDSKEQLEKFRTRWRRWLGQKTRIDKPYWVTLLDSNWSSWPDKVFERIGLDYPSISVKSDRKDVYYIFRCAIYEANMEDLMKLDEIYCADLLKL